MDSLSLTRQSLPKFDSPMGQLPIFSKELPCRYWLLVSGPVFFSTSTVTLTPSFVTTYAISSLAAYSLSQIQENLSCWG